MKISVQNLEGKKVEDIEVSDAVFNVPSNNELLHQVYVAISANKRFAIANTKDKSEVAGTGKKPFKQKGTGNARQGQKRNPVMKGGGVAFGPTSERNFKKDVNKKMKQKAVKIALSEKIRNNSLVVVDEIKFETPKTKLFAAALKNLKIKGKVLIGFDEAEKELGLFSRNIKNVENIPVKDLNVFDMLNNANLVLSKSSVKFLEEKFK